MRANSALLVLELDDVALEPFVLRLDNLALGPDEVVDGAATACAAALP
jgi:hypothetical protein